jgi:signal transduction histidine kinase
VRANRTVETWKLGFVTRVPGLDFHALIHPTCLDPACHFNQFLRQAREKTRMGEPVEIETYDAFLKRYILASVHPVSAQRRVAPSSMVIIVQDISARHQAEEALRRYTARLEAMNELQEAILEARSPEEIAQAALSRLRRLVPFHEARVILFDPQAGGCLVLAADANGETHLRPGTLIPRNAFGESQARRPDQFFVIEELSRLADLSQFEQELRSADICSYVNIPLRAEGEFIGTFNLAAQNPAAFLQEHIDIAREVADLLAIAIRQAQLYRRLKQANAELQEALHVKDEMIQNVSHELRTPLFLIKGYVELLKEGLLGPFTAEQMDVLNTLEMQGNRLLHLVTQLLTLKALDSSVLEKTVLHTETFLRKMVEIWRLQATKTSVQFRLEVAPDLPLCMADLNLISQVIGNLLDNAVKFSPAGGLITVRAGASNGSLMITVADQGIGIPSDKLERVFERFYQVHGGLNRRFGGMGIGLTLCREIVQAHGGRIWAESAGEGHGSTFYVALPIGDNEGRCSDD